MKNLKLLLVFIGLVSFSIVISSAKAQESGDGDHGLLFHLSADEGFTADVAGGKATPNYLNDVHIVEDGVVGSAFSNDHFTQHFVYDAPGNMYAQRGTFAFFWRPRDCVGDVPFILTRAAPADGSALIMNFMRIDYNGEGGFDAFIQNANYGGTRVSYTSDTPPEQGEWHHLALAWDETRGVELYLDGELVARQDTTDLFYQGLDQFGVGKRGISPIYVGNEGYSIRGGDFDEYHIYDRMMDTDQIRQLAEGTTVTGLPPIVRNLDDERWRNQWDFRYGWNRSGDLPPELPASRSSIRKVRVDDAIDVKQRTWRANDGIRDTFWPNVFNRSRVSERDKYIIQPDRNVYKSSGKSVSFHMIDEPFNHIEIAGSAFGPLNWLGYNTDGRQQNEEVQLFHRPSGQERTFHRLNDPLEGGVLRFDNDVQEKAIGKFEVYNIEAGRKPAGRRELTYSIDSNAAVDNATLEDLAEYIAGRYMSDERSTVVALPGGAPREEKPARHAETLPLVHVLIPFEFRHEDYDRQGFSGRSSNVPRYSYTWENIHGGLDGLELSLPALDIEPSHDDLIPLNVKVMDPLWPNRTMMDFSFSVQRGEEQTIWMDMRDRILPNGYPLYLKIASGAEEFSAAKIDGASINLVFKDYQEAREEHVADRFMQAQDNAAHFSEPGANSKKLRSYQRFSLDMEDLLRIDPDHRPGREFWYWNNGEQGPLPYDHSEPPAGVPAWAHHQVELLEQVRDFLSWWYDNRLVKETGEFGGGLSDDGDLTPQFVGAALLGIMPDEITELIKRKLNTNIEYGLFTDGLATFMHDELHAYEEGIEVLSQDKQLAYGDPRALERIMETADAYDRITGINEAGHRHFVSSFFSGSEIADETVWEWQYPHNYLILHAGIRLVDYNNHPQTRELLLEMADGLLAHRIQRVVLDEDEQEYGWVDASLAEDYYGDGEEGEFMVNTIVHFPTDSHDPEHKAGLRHAIHLLWAAYRWTGDEKYLVPILDQGPTSMSTLSGNLLDHLDLRDTWGEEILERTTPHSGSSLFRHLAWQLTDNPHYLEELYKDQIQANASLSYVNTEGHLWTDRVGVRQHELQRARLGGVGYWRSLLYPGHLVSWEFHEPARAEDVAIQIPESDREYALIRGFNLKDREVGATMNAWDLAPGVWEMRREIEVDGGFVSTETRQIELKRAETVDVVFSPFTTTRFTLERIEEAAPLRDRPDVGIGRGDVRVDGSTIRVTVHNLGSVPSPATELVFVDSEGNVVDRADVAAMEPPLDLQPRTTEVELSAPEGTEGRLVLDPDRQIEQINRLNNTYHIK